MDTSLLMQACTVLLGLCLIWIAQNFGKRLMAPSRARGKRKALARHHFVNGAQLLARSRSAGIKPSLSRSLARDANEEADRAIALDPNDAAAHVLKSLALEHQNLLPAALQAMDAALAPAAVMSLSSSEKADALMKRAGLLRATSKSRRSLDAAIQDLQMSLDLSPDSPKVLCMLAACFEKKAMYGEAEKAYEKAFSLNPEWDEARMGLSRLRP